MLNLSAGYSSGTSQLQCGCDLSQYHLSVTTDNSSQTSLVMIIKDCPPWVIMLSNSTYVILKIYGYQMFPQFQKLNVYLSSTYYHALSELRYFMLPCHEKTSQCSHWLTRCQSITNMDLGIPMTSRYSDITYNCILLFHDFCHISYIW